MGEEIWFWKEFKNGDEFDQNTVYDILKEYKQENSFLVLRTF